MNSEIKFVYAKEEEVECVNFDLSLWIYGLNNQSFRILLVKRSISSQYNFWTVPYLIASFDFIITLKVQFLLKVGGRLYWRRKE